MQRRRGEKEKKEIRVEIWDYWEMVAHHPGGHVKTSECLMRPRRTLRMDKEKLEESRLKKEVVRNSCAEKKKDRKFWEEEEQE